MTSSGRSSMFTRFRFPREVIAIAVRWYLRYGLSYRDVEKLLAERGVTVDHVTVPRRPSASCRHRHVRILRWLGAARMSTPGEAVAVAGVAPVDRPGQ